MSQAFLRRGESERIVVYGTDGATKITGATWTLKIVRLDNGQFWNGSAWQVGVATVSMSEPDSVNRPGEYVYTFTPPDFGYICSIIAETSSALIAQRIHAGTLHVGSGIVRDTEIIKKYIANRLLLADPNYTVYEDDGTTPFATGDQSTTERIPD